ncbi:MAG: DUF2891 domain-containing protein [Burkholderiales bacterium]
MTAAPALAPLIAAQFAATALANVVREFPAKQDHVLAGPDDIAGPRALHPAFHGSFDWHSCVHMHWLLARLWRLVPDLPQRDAIRATFDRHLTAANVAGECSYLARPEARTFERTYGWAWLLELVHELGRCDDADIDARRWRSALLPLADAFVARYLDYLPRQRYPLRQGLHANSAFGLAFALDYARAQRVESLEDVVAATAVRWFGDDRDAPAAWEPSGADFLSPALVEADLMRRVLPAGGFASWLVGFLPGLAAGEPAALLVPARVDDRSDPFLVHLDGLNLSRSWCLAGVASSLPADDPRGGRLHHAAAAHLAAGMAGLGSGEYAGEHWLATFALRALTASRPC